QKSIMLSGCIFDRAIAQFQLNAIVANDAPPRISW
ncbi:hypothetical protein CCACVL1_00112, partial [Corchorus capsularis]